STRSASCAARAWTATGCTWWSASRWRSRRTPTTFATWPPSVTRWAISSTRRCPDGVRPMPATFGDGAVDASGLRAAIVVAMFNDQITKRMLAGAVEIAANLGVADGDIQVHWVPGAFELPIVAQRLAESGTVDAIAAIGCVIRGETPHFDFVAGEAARGVMR